MWGKPRFVQAAAALALTANSKNYESVEVFRVVGDSVKRVDIATRQGLENFLSSFSATSATCEAVTQFAADNDDAIVETIFLTTTEGFGPTDRKKLRESDAIPGFVGLCARDGTLELLRPDKIGDRLINRVQVDIEPRQPVVRKNVRKTSEDRPRIFDESPFPLLLPHSASIDRIWSVDDRETVSLTRDGRVMLWARQRTGARQVTTGGRSRTNTLCPNQILRRAVCRSNRTRWQIHTAVD